MKKQNTESSPSRKIKSRWVEDKSPNFCDLPQEIQEASLIYLMYTYVRDVQKNEKTVEATIKFNEACTILGIGE